MHGERSTTRAMPARSTQAYGVRKGVPLTYQDEGEEMVYSFMKVKGVNNFINRRSVANCVEYLGSKYRFCNPTECRISRKYSCNSSRLRWLGTCRESEVPRFY